MTEQHSATTLSIVIGLFAVGGIASVMTGVGPGLILFVAASCSPSPSAAPSPAPFASRTPTSGAADSDRRRPRRDLFVASFVTYSLLIGDTWTVRETVLATIGTLAMFGAVGYLIAGLLTPRTPHYRVAAHAG